jgi:hypothetical protein
MSLKNIYILIRSNILFYILYKIFRNNKIKNTKMLKIQAIRGIFLLGIFIMFFNDNIIFIDIIANLNYRLKENVCLSDQFYLSLLSLEIIAVNSSPMPNPTSMHPTKASGFVFKKKNPTPIPISNPPPIAHELLSSFLFILSICKLFSF